MEPNTVVVAGIALAIGIIIGALLHKFFQTESAKSRRLESQIDQMQAQHTRYQAEVSRHFSHTAELLGRLNANYRDIFNHLAKGAEQLGSEHDFRSLATTSVEQRRYGRKDGAAQSPDSVLMDPPRDYAPKAGPQDVGMLAEEFGFGGKKHPASTEAPQQKS